MHNTPEARSGRKSMVALREALMRIGAIGCQGGLNKEGEVFGLAKEISAGSESLQ